MASVVCTPMSLPLGFLFVLCVCRIPTPLDSQKGKMEVDQGSRERMRGGKVMA